MKSTGTHGCAIKVPILVPPALTWLQSSSSQQTAQQMCALAGLPARAAARVTALEAGAPALAASATCPLRLDDLLDAAHLLTPLLVPDLFHTAAFKRGITLQDARYFYEGAGAAVASTLASVARRFVWRDLLAAQREVSAGRGARVQALPQLLVRVLRTLRRLLISPFLTNEGTDRSTAVREAAAR